MNLFELIVAGGWQTWIIPLVSGFVGWWTNAVAVKMMFEPTEFWGIKPYLGWQGIVPASALKLASRSADLILGQLINVRDLFANFEPKVVAKDLGPALDQMTDDTLRDVIGKHAPQVWANMAPPAQQVVRSMLRAEIETATVDILADFHDNVEKIIDLKKVVMTEVAKDKQIISTMFRTVGDKEFTFIEVSGLYFGLPFGILQMLQWVVLPIWWTLPVAGFAVGYATNWIALKLVFNPQKPTKFGPFVVQGLFHKRQHEVAELYANNIATKVMNPTNIVQTITAGEHGQILFGIVKKHMGALLDKYEKNPMAAMLFPADKREVLRAEMFARLEAELPKAGGFLEQFAARAMDIQGELMTRMRKLDSTSFEGVLRPAFQQDEWKLIVVGGVLGLAAGFVQLVTCFDQVWKSVSF